MKQCHGYLLDWPLWLEFNDSQELIKLKKHYYLSLLEPDWHFLDQLEVTSKRNTYILATACLSYVLECFEFQQLLYTLKMEPRRKLQDLEFFHPMNNNLMTRPSFIMAVFMAFGKSHELLAVPREYVGRKSSKGPSPLAFFVSVTASVFLSVILPRCLIFTNAQL